MRYGETLQEQMPGAGKKAKRKTSMYCVGREAGIAVVIE
jgi:hypothetical protein